MSMSYNDELTPKARLDEIKTLLKLGEISYDEAKKQAEKPLEELNKRIVAISEEYGRRPSKVTFIGFMR